ncbi:MAG: PQQ-binding-like beta-propeller repeat protein, partial [Bacteroidota bacterium]|nr:PQQ-binding-like beta-propeller repeat protein [Bacteroidota bacterium]
GAELWQTPAEYNKSLIEKGTTNAPEFHRRNKYAAFLDNDDCAIISVDSGKQVLNRKSYIPNADLIKQKRPWYFIPDNEKYFAFVTEKGAAMFDLKEDKEIGFRQLKIDPQYNVIVPTSAGCGFFGEEKFIHINNTTEAIAEIPIDIDDMRSYCEVETDSCVVMLLSLKNRLLGVNLETGKVLWQTPERDSVLKGFIHRFIKTQNGNAVVTFVDPTDNIKLYLMSVNALTGKINYKTLLAVADESLPKPARPLSQQNKNFGYDNIGFNYSFTDHGNDIRFLIVTKSVMLVPSTGKEGGEGLVVVNASSGEIVAKNYLMIAEEISFSGGVAALAQPFAVGNLLIIPGNKNLIALNSVTGALRWMLIKEDLKGSYVFDMAMVDTVLYIRTGSYREEFTYDEKKGKVKPKKMWDEDAYALFAIDTATGNMHWKKEFADDPGRIFPEYSIARYVVDNKFLLYGDEKFLYALPLQTKKRDSLQWQFEFSDSGIGKLKYGNLHHLSTRWSHEGAVNSDTVGFYCDSFQVLSTASATGELFEKGISKVLGITYNSLQNKLVAFGEDGIASINPETGKREWYYEWDFNDKKIYHRPEFIGNDIFYFIDGKMTLLNGVMGAPIWQVKTDGDSQVFMMPNKKAVITVLKDEVSGFVIP